MKTLKGFGRSVMIFFKIIFNIYLEGMKNPSKRSLFPGRDLSLDYVNATQGRRSLQRGVQLERIELNGKMRMKK